MENKPKIFEKLEEIAPIIPTPFYWADINCVICGGNDIGLEESTTVYASKLIGKSAHDLYISETAAVIEEHSKIAMQTGKKMTFEETYVDLATGITQYVIATRFPLFEDGKVVGLVGAITDITASKEQARSQAEIEGKEKTLKAIEEITRQEILPSTQRLCIAISANQSCFSAPVQETIPKECERLKQGVVHLENKFKDTEKSPQALSPAVQLIRVASILKQFLANKEKRLSNPAIKLTHTFYPNSVSIFIETNIEAFEQRISCCLDIAIEALGGLGIVNIKLTTDDNNCEIVIENSGNTNQPGDCKKCRMVFTYRIVKTPEWAATEVRLNKGDAVVVLDANNSMLNIWRERFKNYIHDIQIDYLADAERFINSSGKKDELFVITNFGHGRQNLDGVNIIEQIGTKRSILITNNSNELMIKRAMDVGSKILPEQLIQDIEIVVV